MCLSSGLQVGRTSSSGRMARRLPPSQLQALLKAAGLPGSTAVNGCACAASHAECAWPPAWALAVQACRSACLQAHTLTDQPWIHSVRTAHDAWMPVAVQPATLQLPRPLSACSPPCWAFHKPLCATAACSQQSPVEDQDGGEQALRALGSCSVGGNAATGIRALCAM